MRPLAIALAVWHVEGQFDRSHKFLRYCTSSYDEVFKSYTVFIILISFIDIYSKITSSETYQVVTTLTDDSIVIAQRYYLNDTSTSGSPSPSTYIPLSSATPFLQPFTPGGRYPLFPSVQRATTTASGSRGIFPEPAKRRSAAKLAAPHGPAKTPYCPNSATAPSTSTSFVVIAAPTPLLRIGHPISEIVPQHIPVQIVYSASTLVGCPASRLVFRHAAVSGSTVITTGFSALGVR